MNSNGTHAARQPDALAEIVRYFEHKTGGDLRAIHVSSFYGIVAAELEKRRVPTARQPWTWRYIYNVIAGNMPPSRFLTAAIDRLHAEIVTAPQYKPAPVCAKCGDVHVTKTCRNERRVKIRQRVAAYVSPDLKTEMQNTAAELNMTEAEFVRAAVRNLLWVQNAKRHD